MATETRTKFEDIRIGGALKAIGVVLLVGYIDLMLWLGQFFAGIALAMHFHWKYNATGYAGIDTLAGEYLAMGLPLILTIMLTPIIWAAVTSKKYFT